MHALNNRQDGQSCDASANQLSLVFAVSCSQENLFHIDLEMLMQQSKLHNLSETLYYITLHYFYLGCNYLECNFLLRM